MSTRGAEGGTVQIVGAGLLGSSVGLALAASAWQVWISDTDPRAERVAADLGAGTSGWSEAPVDVVLLAVPPSAVVDVMADVFRLYPSATVSDVASVKYEPQAKAESLGVSHRFVGGHPMAGRERGGVTAARADLFDARPWAICAGSDVPHDRVAMVERLVRDCGGDPVRLSAQEHDRAVGLVSHLPQVVASAVAGELRGASEQALALAGQGLRDTIRIAASDADLWSDILASNASVVAPLLAHLGEELADAAKALGDFAADKSTKKEVEKTLQRLLQAGREGYARIPGKHGAPATEYTVVPVVIPDEPGALARLFVAVAEAGASVEDIRLEHSAGHPVGLVELFVTPDQAPSLIAALRAAGWSAH